jgi:serine/threonine-protein kinase
MTGGSSVRQVPSRSTPSTRQIWDTLPLVRSDAPDSAGFCSGDVLGRYELVEPIARGGMGIVWRAKALGSHGFERIVAVKTMVGELGTDPKYRAMFLDEARLAARIAHPNVVQVIDLGDTDRALYLVMEWVEGPTIERLARSAEDDGERLPEGIVLRVLADIAGALHAAHELRGADGRLLHVIHRDVTPQNILVSSDGVAKLIDFGVVKARERLSEETSFGHAKGKAAYMAPEQALAGLLDRRVDVWALGAVLFRLLAGHAPFATRDAFDRYLRRWPASVDRLAEAMAPAVAEVLRATLAPDPNDRAATAADVRGLLERALVESSRNATSDDIAAYVRAYVAKDQERSGERAAGYGHAGAAEATLITGETHVTLATQTMHGASLTGVAPDTRPPSAALFAATQTEALGRGGSPAQAPLADDATGAVQAWKAKVVVLATALAEAQALVAAFAQQHIYAECTQKPLAVGPLLKGASAVVVWSSGGYFDTQGLAGIVRTAAAGAGSRCPIVAVGDGTEEMALPTQTTGQRGGASGIIWVAPSVATIVGRVVEVMSTSA